jgi:secondary thiamine-phosphate synthase enzyme
VSAFQQCFEVQSRGRGTLDIGDQVSQVVAASAISCGIAHVFVRHTSCSVVITENADPAVRGDLEALARRWAPDGDPVYRHDDEGIDDMPAHARSLLTGISISVPIANGRMLLGTWQGIYLWEHRTQPHVREVCVTVIG